MRLFVAIDIDDDIRQRLAMFVAELKASVPEARYTRVEGLHITLKFLGETQKLEALRARLSEVSAPAVPITIAGAGFFPNARRPRVFWAGIEGSPTLGALAEKIDAASAALGFPTETRAFTPHLTLARESTGNPHARTPSHSAALLRIAELLSSRPQPEFGKMRATQFHIYESKLHPKGAIYSKVASFDLKTQE